MPPRSLFIWEKNHIEDCAARGLFKGKDVLEVGGVIPKEYTDQLDVKSWTSIDHADYYENMDSSKYRVVNDSITRDIFEDESFDFVISTNSFEHINDLDIAMQKIYKLLKKGGCLSALLGPIWSCNKGNHIWIHDSGKVYTFNDGLVPDWGHLLYNEQELSALLNKEFDDSIVKQIIFQTYKTDFLNRLFYDDYKDLFCNSGFEVNEFRDWHKPYLPDINMLGLLQKKYDKENFSTVSIKTLLQK